jgi:hypothetical protein
MFELKGTVKVIKDTQVVSEKFKKREFVLTDDSTEYPQDISFQLSQDNVDKLNSIKVGDRILVKFNLRGREWINPQGEAKYFNSLDAWFIQKGDSANNRPDPQPVRMESETNDDLPF